jgi:WD repeat-containing protein 26
VSLLVKFEAVPWTTPADESAACISPAVMLPEHRLAVLLEQVKRDQINNCIYHTSPHWPSLYTDHTCDRSRFPSEAVLELDKQIGEVWQILFSHDGSRLASSGSDRHVTIWDTLSWTVIYRLDAHEGGVGHISWSPDDTMLVTCGSRDRFAKIWKVATGTCHKTLDRLGEPVSSCVWAADSRTLVTGSFDRERALCQWSVDGEMLHNWNSKHRTSDLAVSQDGHWLVAINEGQKLHVYNFVTRELEYDMTLSARPTSISISQDSRSLLINQQDNQAQLFDIVTRQQIQSYVGQTGGEFLIRSSLGGADENFVVSGSEGWFGLPANSE